jgi:hypothetical protein
LPEIMPLAVEILRCFAENLVASSNRGWLDDYKMAAAV